MKIVTAVVNNSDFIEIQYYTLKKYFVGDYEFIVFNDAKDFPDFTNHNDVTIKNKIESLCNSLNIKCINIPNQQHKNNHDAAIRCADSMNYILNYQKNNPDKYLLLDSDMFLVDTFDINKYSNYDCAVVFQTKNNNTIQYFWNGIYYFDMNKIKNKHLLNWDCCKDCDVGGMMQEWLKIQINDSPTKIYYIKHLASNDWDKSKVPDNIKNNNKLIDFFINDVRNENNKFFCELYDNIFVHYRAGGNWRQEGLNIHAKLTKELKDALN